MRIPQMRISPKFNAMQFSFLANMNTADIPQTSGVYAFYKDRQFLYIGKAVNLRSRARNHFQQPTPKDGIFIDSIDRIGYIETDSEIEALLLESLLIKQHKPKYNVIWKDDKNYLFVAITKEPLPRIFFTHQPNRESPTAWYAGPFVETRAIKRTLRALRRVFPYYMYAKAAKPHANKPCQYCQLGLCPGPNPDAKEYRKQIQKLKAILEGKKPRVLAQLQKEMADVSRKQDYERAAGLRDQLRDLEVVLSHARVLQPVQEKQLVNWREIQAYFQQIFQTSRPLSRAEAYDISNIQGVSATGSMPVFIDGIPSRTHYRKFKVRIAGKPDDFAMLREVLTRRLAHAEWKYPDLMIIDGGKGQLSSAMKVISLSPNPEAKNILLCSIAKRHNELFLPGNPNPLLLKDMPAFVSNFILHIRDEAHRFAITYHRSLRKKSLLK